MIILLILSCVVLNTNGRLLTESSCSLSYIYFQPTATVTSSNIYYTTPYIAATNVTPYTNPIPTVVTNYYPGYYPSFTTYLLRKGNQSWRASVIDAAIEKDYKVRGELYYTDSKTGEKWYTHDKVDDNFKAPFARCQQFNRELKTKKNLGSELYKNKRVETIPEDLEVIKNSNQTPAIKSVPIVNKKAEVVAAVAPNAAETPKVVEATKKVEVPKVEVKAETPKVVEAPKVEAVKKVEAPKIEVAKKVEAPKVVEVPKSEVQKVVETPKVQATVTKKEETTEKKAQVEVKPALVNAPNIPVEHKNKIDDKARFLQKGDDFEEEGDMEKFNGDAVAPVEPHHEEKPSEKKHLIEKHSTSNSSEDEDEANENKEEESPDENNSEENNENNENSENSDENLASSNSEKSTSEEEEAVPEENNELSDDERVIENDEETEGLMDMEEEHDQEEMEGELVHDLNPYKEDNPDLL